MAIEPENTFRHESHRQRFLPIVCALDGVSLAAKGIRRTPPAHGLAGGIVDIDDIDLFH